MLLTGVMDPNDVNDKKQTKCLRRPFGVAGKSDFWFHTVGNKSGCNKGGPISYGILFAEILGNVESCSFLLKFSMWIVELCRFLMKSHVLMIIMLQLIASELKGLWVISCLYIKQNKLCLIIGYFFHVYDV